MKGYRLVRNKTGKMFIEYLTACTKPVFTVQMIKSREVFGVSSCFFKDV